MNSTASIIKRARKFKVAEISKITTVSRRTIYALLAGEYKNPRINTLENLDRAISKLEKEKALNSKAGLSAPNRKA